MSLIAMTVFLKTKMHVGTLEDGNKYFGALFFGLINVMFNGMAEMALIIFKLPVFFREDIVLATMEGTFIMLRKCSIELLLLQSYFVCICISRYLEDTYIKMLNNAYIS